MSGVLGYARVSTGDQDVAGQTMRLTQAGAIKVFTDVDADKIAAAIKLVNAGLTPTAAARQLGLGRSTVYRELNRAATKRLPQPA